MAAPKGNEYWKLRKTFESEKKYTPKQVFRKCIEYLTWCEKHPLKEEQVFGTGKRMTVSKMRAPSLFGFFSFTPINKKTFESYEKNEAYLPIITRVRELIYVAKFEGAAAGLLNANIIARELGLPEKIDTNTKSVTEIRLTRAPGKTFGKISTSEQDVLSETND